MFEWIKRFLTRKKHGVDIYDIDLMDVIEHHNDMVFREKMPPRDIV